MESEKSFTRMYLPFRQAILMMARNQFQNMVNDNPSLSGFWDATKDLCILGAILFALNDLFDAPLCLPVSPNNNLYIVEQDDEWLAFKEEYGRMKKVIIDATFKNRSSPFMTKILKLIQEADRQIH